MGKEPVKRKSTHITKQEDVDFILSLNEDTITFSTLADMFGDFNGKTRFRPYDTVSIPKGLYGPEGKKNKEPFITTIGLWIYSRYIIERDLFSVLEYQNYTVSGGVNKGNDAKVAQALVEDKITTEVMKRYIMKQQALMPFVSILTPHFSERMLTSTEEVNKKKIELYKKYEKALKDGDEVAANKMEKELMQFAEAYLMEDPAMDSYNSSARGSFGNHYKNMFIMKGSVKNPITGEYEVLMSNYMDGISAEEYVQMCNSLSEGPYARSQKTAIGGYWEKLFVSAFQHVVTGKEGSNCGTKKYIELVLDNPKDYMYSYIIDGSNLVELNSDNVSKYKGKKVKMRYSSLCEAKDHYCNKCIGNLPYKLGATNMGLYLAAIPARLKNLAMKSFHDSQVKLTEIDVNKAFGVK